MNAVVMIEPEEAQTTRAVAVAQPRTDAQALMSLIERAALDPSFDVAKMERLFAVRKEWKAEEARDAYNRAFTAFKAAGVRVIKNRTVTDGPLKGKKYAELFAVNNAITDELSKHGLSASWKLTKDEKDWIEVTCTLKHDAGHSESVSMGGPPDTGGAKSPMQARASTVTYLERYTLKAVTGLSEQGDDDDAGSSGARQEPAGRGAEPPPAEPYPAADFEKNLPAWREAILAGKTTAAAVIAKVQTKAPLTKQQQARIHGQ